MLQLGISQLGSKETDAKHLVVMPWWSRWHRWNLTRVNNLLALEQATRIIVRKSNF